MSASKSLPRTLPGGAGSSRERRTIVVGAVIVMLALLAAYVVVPFVIGWRLRSAELDNARSHVAELVSITQNARALDSAASEADRALASGGRRVFHARSTTLAASALQSFLQDAADASRLVVTRLDVAPEGDANVATNTATDAPPNGASFVPATLSAYCDVSGLAELLSQFAHGPRMVHVDRMTVQINPSLRGAPDMLQITLSLRAPVVIE